MPQIELREVSLRYGSGEKSVEAVTGVTLAVERGEFIALVGPSGCGKSTVLRLVAGLMRVSGGEGKVDDTPLHRPLGNVGIAFQNPTLLPWRTVLQNVLLPLEVNPVHKDKYRANPKPYLEAARELLASVGLGGFEDKSPWQLSGGMQQRANLCRALIHRPEILLLDEPFGALDAFTREELWLALQTLWEHEKCTVILVTHDLREAVLLADTVYMMSARPGKIIYQCPIGLPRPRTLESTYDATFVEIVRDLRERIGGMRHKVGDLRRG
jgi:NitT/TauT family transport system ATP-binding protein